MNESESSNSSPTKKNESALNKLIAERLAEMEAHPERLVDAFEMIDNLRKPMGGS